MQSKSLSSLFIVLLGCSINLCGMSIEDRLADPLWKRARGNARSAIIQALNEKKGGSWQSRLMPYLTSEDGRIALLRHVEHALGGKEVIMHEVDVADYIRMALAQKEITRAKLGLE